MFASVRMRGKIHIKKDNKLQFYSGSKQNIGTFVKANSL